MGLRPSRIILTGDVWIILSPTRFLAMKAFDRHLIFIFSVSFFHFKHLQTMRLIYWLNDRNIARPRAALKPYSSQTLRLLSKATGNNSQMSQSEFHLSGKMCSGCEGSWVKQILLNRTRKLHQVNHVDLILAGRKCCYTVIRPGMIPPVFKTTLR